MPHAGWICSGHVAAGVFRALAECAAPEVVVLFGAVHRWPGDRAAVDREGAWMTPLGAVPIATELADGLLANDRLFEDAPAAHAGEHSLEVQAPLVRHFFPQAEILPILVPANSLAVEIGRAVGEMLLARSTSAVVVGTSDLTHYGPGYRFTPHGVGEAGLHWAREVNDRRMIDLIASLAEGEIVREAETHLNACGGGAIAATIAATCRLGGSRAVVVEHTTSQLVLRRASADAVGYVGVVFGD